MAVLLLVTDSPPPATFAVLTSVPVGSVGAMLTSKLIGGQLAPAANTSLREQASGDSVHDQPEPLIAVAVTPDGSVSVIWTGAFVGPAPMLLTTNVHNAPTWPWLKLPLWLLVMVRSGRASATVVIVVGC